MKSTDIKSLDRLFALVEVDQGRCPSPELLDGYIRGTLPELLREVIEEHLTSCVDCHETVTDVTSALANDDSEPEWLVRARTMLEAFTLWAAGVKSGIEDAVQVDAVQGAAALLALLGAEPQIVGVRESTAMAKSTVADLLQACEQALRNAELSDLPTVTLATTGWELRLIKLRGGQWALKAKPKGGPDWQPFTLVVYSGEREVGRVASEGATLRLDQLGALVGKKPSRYSIKFSDLRKTSPEL